jgi:hypothetical protein
MQLIGTYRGPHQLNIQLGYPQTSRPTTVYQPKTPDPSKPYVVSFAPKYPVTPSFRLRAYATFTDIETPGASFELELVAAEVGIDRRPGMFKTRNQTRSS